MSSEKKNWFGWLKNIVAAIIGAIISCAATIGIIKTDDAEVAKQKIDGWLTKSETAYVQIVAVGDTINEVKKLIEEKKYLEALGKLESIKDNAVGTIAIIKELKDEISESIKNVSGDAKDKVDEIKDVVSDVVDNVKEAVGESAQEATTQE